MNRWAAIARFGGIGDNLMAASPLKGLKRLGYMTEVITSEPGHVVYLHNPYIDKLSIKKVERDLPQNDMNAWQGWIESRAKEYDVFIHASHSCEGRHAVFKTMSSFWWPVEYRRKLCAGSYIETVHDIAGVPYDFGPLFFTSPEEREFALRTKAKLGERFIAWIVSGSRIDKVYPYSTYAVGRIIKELGATVMLIGGPSEKEASMVNHIKETVAIQNGSKDGVFSMSTEGGRHPDVRTSLALVQASDLVVTPDTGPAWAVAFEDVPKVLMVSHASAENIGKHWVNTAVLHADPERVPCWPCHRLHDDTSTCVENKEGNGAACISDISVDRLLEAVAERWKSNNIVSMRRLPAVGREHGRARSLASGDA